MYNIKERRSNWALSGFMFLSSTIILVVGTPRLLHELMLVPGTPLLHHLNAGEALTAEDWRALEQSRLAALKFAKLPDTYTDLGASYLRRAQTAKSREIQVDYVRMAGEVSMKGLEMAPFNTYAWLRICGANLILGPEHFDQALEGWRNSIKMARFEPSLFFSRIHYGIILFDSLSQGDKAWLGNQLEMAYRWNRGKLRQYFIRYNLLEWAIFLANDNEKMVSYFKEKLPAKH